jgi:hypothetical protein
MGRPYSGPIFILGLLTSALIGFGTLLRSQESRPETRLNIKRKLILTLLTTFSSFLLAIWEGVFEL